MKDSWFVFSVVFLLAYLCICKYSFWSVFLECVDKKNKATVIVSDNKESRLDVSEGIFSDMQACWGHFHH